MKKKILQVVLVALMALPAQAFCFGDAAINIRNFDNDLITVMIDGVQYPTAVNEFHLSGIDAGRHLVKVFTRERYGWNYSNFTHLAFNGSVMLKCGEEIFAEIDRFNQMHIKRVMSFIQPAPVTLISKPGLACRNSFDNNYHQDNCNHIDYNYGPFAMDDQSFCAL